MLTPGKIKNGLGTQWLGQQTVLCLEVVGSTNEEAHRLGREGAPEGTILIAETQTTGRGRQGRSWESPEGKGLYLSMVLRPHCAPEMLPGLTLAAGVSVASAIQATGLSPKLKWPNDVLIDHRKVGGILTEAVFSGGRVDFAVVGIGINVNMESLEFPESVRDLATSLSASLGQPVSRVLLLQSVLSQQEHWYELFSSGAFEKILTKWRQFDATLGEMVEVILPNERLAGVAESLAEDGALLIRDEGGDLIRIVAGDVVHCQLQRRTEFGRG
jgi:BirA family biotin operon repressor/biotin-[acetyl-CoA-carboxylase] ligase